MLVNIMRTDLLMIGEGAPVAEAAKKMQREKVGSLLVERNGTPVGLLTETDIVRQGVGANKPLHQIPVGDLMTTPLPTIQVARTSHDAIDLMGDLHTRHLAVCDGERVVGVVSARDLLRYFRNLSEPKIGVD